MYSQNNEEAYILEAVKSVENRRFLDVGGYHFETFSNTRQLFLNGWSGVMIEPAPHLMSGLVRDLGHEERIELVSAAVGTEAGMTTLYVTADMLSTTNAEWQAKRADAAVWLGKMRVPVITFTDISNLWGGFEFVSIDTEGTSVELCFDMMARDWRPKCICCEEDGRMRELCERMTARYGYQLVYASQENAVLVRRE